MCLVSIQIKSSRSGVVPTCCQESPLHQTPPLRANYAESFRCIGSACEDTCCQGWSVPIDQAAYRMPKLAPSPLRTLILASLLRMPEGAKLAASPNSR